MLAITSGVNLSSAASLTWNGGGGDNNWSTPANWGGTAPTPGDLLFFDGSVRTTTTNNFAAGTLFNGIGFNNTAAGFTLRGNSITLGGDIVDNTALVPQTNLLALSLNGTRTVNVTTDGLLTLNGVISGPGFGLTKTGGGQVTLGAVNTFTGPVTIFEGILSIGSDANLSATSGHLVIDGGALRTTSSFTLNANRGISLGSPTDPACVNCITVGTITVTSGTTLTYGGTIANGPIIPGGLIKNAFGGLTLFGANTYTGPTIVQNGTLTLDFTQTSSPVNNIISSNFPTSTLTLGGANAGLGTASFAALTMDGKGATTDSQTFNGTTIDIGPAIIRANSGAGGAANMILGALTHNPGGIVNVVTPTATGGAGSITTTTPNAQGILGGWATVGNGGVFNNITMGTDWASVDGSGNIVPYTGYRVYASGEVVHDVATAATNLRINGSSTGDVTVNAPAAGTTTDLNTINLSETRAFSLVIGDGNTLRLGRFGSIFKSDNANNITWALGSGTTGGANGVQDQGTLTAGGAPDTAGEIVFYMNNGSSQSQGSLNVEAKVTDNGSGPVTVVKAGPSSMKLRGHNTFSGGLYLLQGRLQFAGGEIGTTNPDGGGTGPIVVMPGAYLFPSGAGSTLTNRFFVAGVGTQQEPVGAIRFGNGWFISGDITLLGDARLGGGNAATVATTGVGGKISGAFNLDLGARQTINSFFTLSNPLNDWTGTTTLNARNTATANMIRNGASEVIPHGVGKGNVIIDGNSNTGTITWDLNGFNETINGLLSAGNLAGCIILNNAAGTTSVLTVGDYDQTGTFGGSIQNGGGTVDLTKIGGGRQTLTGVNTYTGVTTVNGGTLALSGSGSIATSGQILVNGATLDVSEVAGGFTHNFPIDINNGVLAVRSTVAPGISSLTLTDARVRVTTLGATPLTVEATTLSTGGQTNLIDIASVGLISGYPAQFTIIKYTGTIGGADFNFGLGNVPTPSTVGFISNNVDNSSVDLVLLDGPKTLTWLGVNNNDWDINTTLNWRAFGVTPSVYLDVDSVRFDDAGVLKTVDLATTLQPGAILVNNTVNYTFTGPGSITGPGGLTKEGAGTLILNNGGTNDFFGPTEINAGTLQVGNADANGSLGAGSVVNNSSLTFARSDAVAVGNIISGAGTLTQNGSGVLTLSGDSTFTGPAVAAQGTLRAGSALALGAADGGTTVNPGATLDVNGQNLGAESVTVSGTGVGNNGAIVNTGAGQNNALRFVTLAGPTTFGGSSRWDIRQANGSATLLSGGNAHKITKVGSNQVSLVNLTDVDPALGDIEIQQGLFRVEGTTVQLGSSLATVTVYSNATLAFFNLNPNPLNKLIVLRSGATVLNESGVSAISGAVTLEGDATFNAASAGTTPMLSSGGGINGAGNLIKIGAGPMTLNGQNDYTGGTLVSNGTLFVDGSHVGAGSITVHGGTLAGIGTISGPVTIGAAGTLSPGNALTPISTLEINNAVILSGTTVMDIDKSQVGLTHDVVAFATSITYGGTLRINVAGPALAASDEFALFNTASGSGAFTTIIPATPGPGLAWDTSQIAADGLLKVVSALPRIGGITQAGTNVVISGMNGTTGGAAYLLSSTNVALPRSTWIPLATNVFDLGGNVSFTNAVDPNFPQRFFLLEFP